VLPAAWKGESPAGRNSTLPSSISVMQGSRALATGLEDAWMSVGLDDVMGLAQTCGARDAAADLAFTTAPG
jgi:hypothetical protein